MGLMSIGKYSNFIIQISVGFSIGAVIACSPTKFESANTTSGGCISSGASTCVVINSYEHREEPFKVGAGKVDILFVDDNSASMSFEQKEMAARFGAFVENLDAREIDYRIAVITTDLAATQSKRFITFANGKSFLSNLDSNRVGMFNQAIARPETLACENFIRGAINNYGPQWRSDDRYQSGYYINCPSPDEQGIATASLVLSENTESFVRADANLSIIVISDENEHAGRSTSFIDMMNTTYPTKYWDFNSIIVRDNSCKNIQSNQIKDQQNVSAVGAAIGSEYAAISASAAKDIDNNPRPRGQWLNICQSNYTQHFTTIATSISEAARSYPLSCQPSEPPTVERVSNSNQTVPYTWDGNQRIVFQRGSEGIPVKVKYRCYKDPA